LASSMSHLQATWFVSYTCETSNSVFCHHFRYWLLETTTWHPACHIFRPLDSSPTKSYIWGLLPRHIWAFNSVLNVTSSDHRLTSSMSCYLQTTWFVSYFIIFKAWHHLVRLLPHVTFEASKLCHFQVLSVTSWDHYFATSSIRRFGSSHIWGRLRALISRWSHTWQPLACHIFRPLGSSLITCHIQGL
jgi:hypothetical protein